MAKGKTVQKKDPQTNIKQSHPINKKGKTIQKKDPQTNIKQSHPINKKGKTIQKKDPQTNIKQSHPISKKALQKQSNYHIEETQGQFVQKRRIKKPANIKNINQQANITTIQTPKIKNKNNIKEYQEKITQRPHKKLNQNNNLPYKQQQQNSQLFRQQFYYENIKQKEQIDLTLILTTLKKLKDATEQQSQLLMSRQIVKNKEKLQIYNKLINSNYFRFCKVKNRQHVIERYGQLIQSFQILISKLNNRIGKNIHFHKVASDQQEKLLKIYVHGQSDFLLFFKHFFSKPFTLCNLGSTRKIIQVLWQSIFFKIKSITKLYAQLKLWVFGISIPINPTLIALHKIIFKNPELITKYAKMIYNQKIYMGINQVDPLLRTPLMLAAQISCKQSFQKLIKC